MVDAFRSVPVHERARGALLGAIAGAAAVHRLEGQPGILDMPLVAELIAVGKALLQTDRIAPEELYAALVATRPEGAERSPPDPLAPSKRVVPVSIRYHQDPSALNRQTRLCATADADYGLATELAVCQAAAIAAAIRGGDVIAAAAGAAESPLLTDFAERTARGPTAPLAHALEAATRADTFGDALEMARSTHARSVALTGPLAGARFGSPAVERTPLARPENTPRRPWHAHAARRSPRERNGDREQLSDHNAPSRRARVALVR